MPVDIFADKPMTAEAGNLLFTFNGGFSPKALPKKALAPITLTASGKIATKDGTHPPALKEAIVETDKNGAVNVKGLPVCGASQLQSRDTAAARKACPKAVIGTGKNHRRDCASRTASRFCLALSDAVLAAAVAVARALVSA